MVDVMNFFPSFRLFDLGRGSKWSILLNFFNFSTFRPEWGGRIKMVDFIEVLRLFDLKVRVQMVDFIKFFLLFDFSTLGGRFQMVDFIDFFHLFDFSTWGDGPNGRFY